MARHGVDDAVASELIGYASRFSAAPGDELAFMVSAEHEACEAQLVRLLHGDERSAIGLVEREVPSSLDGTWPLERQQARTGSFGVVDVGELSAVHADGVSGHVFVCPTLVDGVRPQGLLALLTEDDEPAWELVVERGGDLVLRAFDLDGAQSSVRLSGALSGRAWHSVSFAIDGSRRRLALWSTALGGPAAGDMQQAAADIAGAAPARGAATLLLAARRLVRGSRDLRAADSFNGKLERAALIAGVLDTDSAARLGGDDDPAAVSGSVLLDLDLAAGSTGWGLVDRSGRACRGRLYNAPLRLCTSHAWRGQSLAPAGAPEAYAAIHFHDDDMLDAGWHPTCDWVVPDDLASGVYALRLRAGGQTDRIPFVVRPRRERATNAVALWLPSFTYAAYANVRSLPGTPFGDFQPERPDGDELLSRHPEWGGSTYDLHPDGTGVAISSLARPVPNMRPTYRSPLVNGPRHLAADLCLVHWLAHLGIPCDVFGDEDVHAEGAALLSRYATVLTGSHPEYVTSQELDAIEEYTDRGGRLMYMGGNGFYWVTTVADGSGPGPTVEVRRGHAGTRSWDAEPGEEHHQFTGEPGGLWRHRGRPPHALVGIGFVAEGRDGRNRPYRRAHDGLQPAGAWAFEGIAEEELIGGEGLVMGGAAGDELDSADHALGTPLETLVLASSSGHSDAYWVVLEDLLVNEAGLSGTQDPRIRADITVTPRRNGGAVFTVGSMSWTAALSARGYENAAARLSENVLRAFRSTASPWLSHGPVDPRAPALDA